MSKSAQLSALAILPRPACEVLRRVFSKQAWKLVETETLQSGLSAQQASRAPIVILDRDLAGDDWRPAVRQFAAELHCECVILASRVVDDYLVEEVIQQGGYDVLAEPLQEREVVHTMEFGWAHCRAKHYT